MAVERTDPVALVTGGGHGIGAAVCARLAGLGYRVAVADVDLVAAGTVAASIAAGSPDTDTATAFPIPVDVSDPDANRSMVAAVQARYGRLDVAVLNAGIRADQPPDAPIDVDAYRRVNGVNVDSVVFGIDAVTPLMAGTGGAIVVTASLAALGPDQANPVYALGKSAVLGYVRAMSVPLAQRRITINAICPGFTDTAILGIAKRLIRKQGFPLLSPDDVADAVAAVLVKAGTGEAWPVVAGRPPARYEFPPVPATLAADGGEVELRPFLAPR